MEMADGDRLTPEQAEALSALRDGRNVFLSGNAGTGKSYVLNAFISDLKARNVDFLALAPTGIAALNLTDGSTIHRTLKIAPGVCAPDGPKGSRKVLDAAKVIIIDEISMCRIDLFDHVMGMISQSMTRNGAKQVVLVGDFFQLPPVVTERDSALLMKFYPGNLQGWCFKSRYWTGFDFEPHVLKTVVRQSAPDFIDNLNRARVGDASCLDYFNAHSRSSRAYLPKDTLVLCANNRIADSINRENVDALDAPKVEFTAAVTGMVNSGDKMAPERIVLCRGARVMSLVNSPQEGYVNGTQGTTPAPTPARRSSSPWTRPPWSGRSASSGPRRRPSATGSGRRLRPGCGRRNGIGGKRNAYSSTASPAPHIAPWRTRRSIPSCASAV